MKENHEIQLKGEYAKILIYILNKRGIKYAMNDQGNNNFVFNIYKKDIDIIYDILTVEMIGGEQDVATKDFNNYGIKVDHLLGDFAAIKYKLKPPSAEKAIPGQ